MLSKKSLVLHKYYQTSILLMIEGDEIKKRLKKKKFKKYLAKHLIGMADGETDIFVKRIEIEKKKKPTKK